jgi:hypothetical protein
MQRMNGRQMREKENKSKMKRERINQLSTLLSSSFSRSDIGFFGLVLRNISPVRSILQTGVG